MNPFPACDRSFLTVGLINLLLCAPQPALAQQWETVASPTSILEKGYIQVVGGSESGQSRFRALRAATVAAQRDLLEAFQGVTVAGQATVKDGMLVSDKINTSVRGFLRGAHKCGESYNEAQGYAEVCMRLHIRGKNGAYDVVLPLLSAEGIVAKALPTKPAATADAEQQKSATPTTPPHAPVSTPSPTSGLPSAADGLLLDVAGLGFKPAMVNRIVTERGDLVFGPSKIINAVLVERGCGGYTNQSEKAKGLLALWGSQSPVQIKAIAVRQGTDAVIRSADAETLLYYDRETSFLSQAKVVYLIR